MNGATFDSDITALQHRVAFLEQARTQDAARITALSQRLARLENIITAMASAAVDLSEYTPPDGMIIVCEDGV